MEPSLLAAHDASSDAQTRAEHGNGQEPPARPRLKLKTMDDLKSELARLYRDGKAGRRDIADVSKLANVLSIVGRLVEDVDLATRLDALELREQGKR